MLIKGQLVDTLQKQKIENATISVITITDSSLVGFTRSDVEGNFVLEPDENMERVYPLPANDSIYHFTYPVAEYDHDEGAAISGGYEYWGAAIPQLKGKYLFGDIPSGRLFYINLADIRQGKQAPIKEWKATINGKTKTLKELCGADRVDLHFGADARGELYILTKADGKVYQLTGAVIK